MSFCHLHLHTSASTLDSPASIEEYAKLAKEYKMPAMGITDHGNMSNVYNFCKILKKYDVKPIIGCEFYLYNDIIFKDKELSEVPTSHQIVLVKNKEGYINSNKLNYFSFTDTFYRKPLVKRSMLYENSNGLIITSSCMISEINQLILKNKIQDAIRLLNEVKEVFKDDFYVEIQLNEVEGQKKVNETLINWAKYSKTKVVITGDVHYTKQDDSRVQDLIIAIKRHSDPEDEKSWRIGARYLYFHNREDYYMLNKKFEYGYDDSFIDECLDNTLEIGSKSNYSLEFGKNNFPIYISNNEEKEDTNKFFQRIIKEGLNRKIESGAIDKKDMQVYLNRIKYEYDILISKGYVDYFLIIWDVIDYAKRNGVFVGSGRGSVSGSLIAYLIGITTIDSVKYGLYFERFINPERLTNPDIDFDIESERRDELEQYLINKYGKDHVCKVITFGTYQIKGVLRDLTRVLNRNKEQIDSVCKMIPEYNHDIKKWTVSDVLDLAEEQSQSNLPGLKKFRDWRKDNKDIVYYAGRMLNQIRHFGTHAGGIVITPKPIWNYMPINRIHGEIISGFEESWTNKALSDLGILKIDALGLRTLTLFKYTIELIKKTRGIDITETLNNIDLEDKKLIDDFAKAENLGVFQFESNGVSKLIKKVKPDCFADIVAINALNRPATLGNGMAYKYAEWKNDPNLIDLPHSILKDYLKNTHGILVYQETLMYILVKLTGYSYAEADIGRKLLDRGKEQEEYKTYIAKLKQDIKKFNNMEDHEVDDIVEWIESYSGYAFNLSHSLSYAYLAMQTLYLKNYYPLEYYTSLLTLSGEEDVSFYLKAIAKNIDILPLDINKSDFNFTVDGDKIRMGLKVIKSFGLKAWDEIQRTKPYDSIENFFKADIKWAKVNKKVCASLAKVGAFSSLESNINLVLYWLEKGKKVDREINIPEPRQREKENWFYDITGISTFSAKELEASGFKKASEWECVEDFVYGKVEDYIQKTTKNNKPYYIVKITDGAENISFIVWNNKWNENTFEKGNIILMQLDKNDFGYNLYGDCYVYEKGNKE